MPRIYALLVTAVAFFVTELSNPAKPSQMVVQAESVADLEHDTSKRLSAQDDTESEERMFATTINGVLGKVGSVVETGGVKEAPKLEKHLQWLRDGLTPSQVRVDVLKKEPWMKWKYLWNHEDFGQYVLFMVKYEKLHPNGV